VRRPRVQITYDVETGGAQQIKELPFVVGVMADLSGQPKDAPKPLKERKFIPIDRDNFNNVLEKAAPRVAVTVPNRLSDEGKDSMLNVEVSFKNIDDFEPAAVARQVPALKQLLEMRDQLNQLLGKMEGNDKLAELLSDILTDGDTAKEAAGELGVK
jgi:type VI secretion system protein ImpB